MNKQILLGDVANEKKIPSRKLVKVYQADNGITYHPVANVTGCDKMVLANISVYGYPISRNTAIRDPEITKHLHESGEETVYEFDSDKVTTDVFEPGTIWSHKKRLYVSDGEGLFLVDAGNTIMVRSDDHPNDDNDEDDDYEDNEGIATLSEMRQPVESVISGLVSSIRYNTYETVTGDMILIEECSHDDILQKNQTYMMIENGFNYNQKSKTKMVNLLKDKILTVPENHHVGLMLSDNEDHMIKFDKLGVLTFRVYSRENENDEWHDTGYETLKRVERLKQNDVTELNELFKFNGIDNNEFELCRDLIDFDDYELGWPFESITTLSFISKAGEPPRLYLAINVAKSESERDVHEFKTYDLENNKWETHTDLSKLVNWVVYRTCYTNAIRQNMNVIER